MTVSFWRGHKIDYVNGIWLYSDNNLPVSEDKNRACGHCGKPQTKQGHDGCLGTLKSVKNACCGHGKTNEAYIQFLDGAELRGVEAVGYYRGDRG